MGKKHDALVSRIERLERQLAEIRAQRSPTATSRSEYMEWSRRLDDLETRVATWDQIRQALNKPFAPNPDFDPALPPSELNPPFEITVTNEPLVELQDGTEI